MQIAWCSTPYETMPALIWIGKKRAAQNQNNNRETRETKATTRIPVSRLWVNRIRSSLPKERKKKKKDIPFITNGWDIRFKTGHRKKKLIKLRKYQRDDERELKNRATFPFVRYKLDPDHQSSILGKPNNNRYRAKATAYFHLINSGMLASFQNLFSPKKLAKEVKGHFAGAAFPLNKLEFLSIPFIGAECRVSSVSRRYLVSSSLSWLVELLASWLAEL